jgi:dihydroxy-acid dehydratase
MDVANIANIGEGRRVMSGSSGTPDDRGGGQARSAAPEIPDFVKDIVENVVIPPLLHGCGYSQSDLARPRIGIANTWTELNPGHVHLDGIAGKVREGLRNAGLTPFGFNTIAPCDGISEGHEGMRYILPAREVIADSVEIMAKVNRLQGLVLIGSCDKIVPGLLMAAARIDIPSIIITGGYHLPYCYPDKTFAEEVEFAHYEIGKFAFARGAGKISDEEFDRALRGIVTGPGSCPMLGTAMTMQCMTEVLGMSLPYSAILPGRSEAKSDFALKTGEAMKRLVERGITPSRIMTMESFENAIVVLHTMGGSTNALLHLPAIANELGLRLPIERFDELSRSTPQTCAIKPNGPRAIEAIDEAGGIPAVMQNVRSLLNLDVVNVTGRTLGETLADVVVKDHDIIRPLTHPYRADGGLAVLKGNLAPRGAVVKKSAVSEKMLTFKGPARVFECEEEAIVGMLRQSVRPGECVVIRYEGPRGGPGMREMSIAAHVLQLLGLGDSSALITDGRYSGTNYGLCVGHLSPEAADGGVLAVVRDGDTIEIDIPGRIIRVDLSERELQQRLGQWKAPEPEHDKGILSWYARNVAPSDEGAVLGPRRAPHRI